MGIIKEPTRDRKNSEKQLLPLKSQRGNYVIQPKWNLAPRRWIPAGAHRGHSHHRTETWRNRERIPQPLSPSATDLPPVSSIGQNHPEARWPEDQWYRVSPQGQDGRREEEEEKEARRMGIKKKKFMVSDTEGVLGGFYTGYCKKLKNVQDI